MFRKNRFKKILKNEMYRFFRNMKCVYMEKHTLRHKIERYLIQVYIDIAGGVIKDTPFTMPQSRVTKSVTFNY